MNQTLPQRLCFFLAVNVHSGFDAVWKASETRKQVRQVKCTHLRCWNMQCETKKFERNYCRRRSPSGPDGTLCRLTVLCKVQDFWGRDFGPARFWAVCNYYLKHSFCLQKLFFFFRIKIKNKSTKPLQIFYLCYTLMKIIFKKTIKTCLILYRIFLIMEFSSWKLNKCDFWDFLGRNCLSSIWLCGRKRVGLDIIFPKLK